MELLVEVAEALDELLAQPMRTRTLAEAASWATSLE
jgi:hypothetical protein